MSPSTHPESATVAPTGCCPPFDPATYQEKEVTWDHKLFMREHVRSIFHVPLNMGKKITHAMEMAAAAQAQPAQGLMLSDEKSPWRSDLYIDVLKAVPGAEMATLSGTYLTKVYDGPFSEVPKWAEDMRHYVEGKGKTLNKLYFAYTTCPACAKAYGHNYVVVFADVTPDIDLQQ